MGVWGLWGHYVTGVWGVEGYMEESEEQEGRKREERQINDPPAKRREVEKQMQKEKPPLGDKETLGQRGKVAHADLFL